MKNWLISILLLPSLAFAQPYGNEWIDYNKEYYKISIAEDGIFKVTYDDLLAVGFPIGSNAPSNPVDPRRIQLFHRGVEVAIHMEGQLDAVFDPADYIEFYGQKNDGTLDEALYITPAAQPHKYYNLYSDTAAYFLTYHKIGLEGNRMTTLSPFTGVPKDDYYTDEVLKVYTDNYLKGIIENSYSTISQFDVGEGFSGSRITEITSPVADFVLTGLDLPVISAPTPTLAIQLVGWNKSIHDIEVFAGPNISSLSSLGTYSFNQYNNLNISENINWAAISGSGELVVRVTILDNGGIHSNMSVSYIKLNYARQVDHINDSYRAYDLKVQVAGGSVVEFLNTPTGSKAIDITDVANVGLVVDTDVNANTITCGFSNATVPRKLVVATPSNSFSLKKIGGFRNIYPSLSNYLVISNKVLMQPAGGTTDAVRAYAGYRASAAGGAFDTLVVDIDRLYDQFNFGEVSPLAIFQFMAYMVNNGNPKHLLLIGKALDVSYKYHRRDPALFSYHDLVPTSGSPGSDILFTSGLNGTTYENAVPTGRLSVSSPQQIINYLNKVVEMESTPYDQLWRKNVLHLSGGSSALELSLFKSYVDGFKAVAEDLYLGGEVSTVSKATTSTVEFINSSEKVNEGLNLITFFGHSAPTVTDIDIGMVSDSDNGYNNKGKYPIVLMNGCNAGNIFGNSYIFGEDWIATADKGATAVLAHSSFGYAFSLRGWTDIFYSIAYADPVFMEKSVGEIQIEVEKRLLAKVGPIPNYIYLAQIQQMGLQGDPAVKVFGTHVPDYEINLNNIDTKSLTNQGISSDADSFAIVLRVRNFGAYLNDSLEVFVRRTLQNGFVKDYDTITFAPVKYLDTLFYTITNNLPNNAGINSFEIVLDPANKLQEHDEFNNRVFYNKDIPLSGTINISPPQFSIQSQPTIDIATQSGNRLSPSRGYLFELDSTLLFTSPFKQTTNISTQQLAIWEDVNLTANDSIAYYWRTKYEQLNANEADEWSDNSFTYINGGDEGWAQVEYHQMKNNGMQGLEANEGGRSIDFLQNDLFVEVVSHGANSIDYTYLDTEVIIDGLKFIYPGSVTLCATNRLNIVAFNQQNAAPYAPIAGNQLDGWTCGRSPQIINSYPGGKSLDDILDAIPIGDKVLIFTIGSFDFTALSGATLSKLEELGANPAILSAKLPAEPYIMIGLKGAGSGNSTAEIIADPVSATPTDEQSISYSGIVSGVFASGKLTSPDIGPALSWSKLSLKISTLEPSDEFTFDVIGKSLAGAETNLFNNLQLTELDLSPVDATVYPYLKLRLHLQDDAAKTAPQLDKWLVNYTLPAEGFISYIDNSEGGGLNLTVQEGQDITTNFAFINTSNNIFSDSLLVKYTIFNQDQRNSETVEFNISAPAPHDTTFFAIAINTRSRVGLNNLEVAINPLVIAEQIYQNNNISLVDYLKIVKDRANPLLEVSFDGEYIFDGDIVSPNPNIHIVLRDENPYLLKTDTAGVNVSIKKPCEGCISERISLAGNDISWVPQADGKPFSIDYKPKNLADGIYELSVQVEDASGNKAGPEPYAIHFEVINKSSITNFYPYPNPFSTSVKFIFTLTGNEIPDELMIRIFTVSGRVVREITQDELGPLRIGNNATDYAWDGHDEFGDQLANGFYLFKVLIRKNGENIELRESAGDRGFKNGYGKLYLLR